MGGCSSKPETSECVGHTPSASKQELNSLLSGFKAIDPSNPSPYTASQHTLQSLFIQHHRDGDDGQTLQELLLDSKSLPNFENGIAESHLASKDLLSSSSCKHCSPISVLHQEAEKCSPTEGNLLSRKDEDNSSSSALAEQHADNCSSSKQQFHGILPEPKSDHFPFPEPNLSASTSAHLVDETTMSKAVPDVQAMEDGSSRRELEVEEAQNPLRHFKCMSVVATEKDAVEVSIETKVKAEIELEKAAQTVEYKASQEHKKEAAPDVEAMGTHELLLVHHDDDSSAKSHLQDEKAVNCNILREIAKKSIEGEKAGLQAERVIEGGKAGVQDNNQIGSEKVGLQNDRNDESEKDRMQYREGEVENKTNLCMGHEGEKEEVKDDEKASVQDAVMRVNNEHAEVIGSDKVESMNVQKVSTVQAGERDELQCGLQNSEELGVRDERDLFDDKANKKHEEAEIEIAMASMSTLSVSESSAFKLEPMHIDPTKAETSSNACMQPDSTTAACQPATARIGDVEFNCEVNEEAKADQGKLSLIENAVKEADLGPTEKLNSGEGKLALSGKFEVGMTHNVAEKYESEEKIMEGTEHIQKDELQETITDVARKSKLIDQQQKDDSPSAFEINKKLHDQALELCSSEDKKADEVLLQQSPVEDNGTENLESRQIEPTVELEHDKSDATDSKAKQEESIESHELKKAYDEQSQFYQSSGNLKSTPCGQTEKPSDGLEINTHIGVEAEPIEKPSDGLDVNTHTGVEADQLLQMSVKLDSQGPHMCPTDVTFNVNEAEGKAFGIVKDEVKAQLDPSKRNDVNREEPKATQKLENLEDDMHCADNCANLTDAKCEVVEPKCEELHRARDNLDDAPLPSSSLSVHQ